MAKTKTTAVVDCISEEVARQEYYDQKTAKQVAEKRTLLESTSDAELGRMIRQFRTSRDFLQARGVSGY